MRKKQFQYGMYGALIGFVLGILVGFGSLSQVKKSQRANVLPFALIICTAFCTIGGCRVGMKIGRDYYVEERLGTDKLIDDGFFKEGRYWVGVTKWVDRRDNKQHVLHTAKSNQSILVSSLDGRVIMKHDCSSASQTTVPKHHNLAKAYVFSRLRENFRENAQPIETLFTILR